MKYYWKITKVFIDSLSNEVGISCGDKSLKSNSKIFTMYDDDNNCYYPDEREADWPCGFRGFALEGEFRGSDLVGPIVVTGCDGTEF